MSVIAWDGHILAADRQTNSGETISSTTKLIVHQNRVLAWCGRVDYCLELAQWYMDGADPDKYPAFQRNKEDWQRLVVADTACPTVYEYIQSPYPIVCEVPFDAWGSGAPYALAAMAAMPVPDAVEAVIIASRICLTVGGGIDYFDFRIKKLGRYNVKMEYGMVIKAKDGI